MAKVDVLKEKCANYRLKIALIFVAFFSAGLVGVSGKLTDEHETLLLLLMIFLFIIGVLLFEKLRKELRNLEKCD